MMKVLRAIAVFLDTPIYDHYIRLKYRKVYKNWGALEDKVHEWHMSDSPLHLYEYLGLTWEEYRAFVERR